MGVRMLDKAIQPTMEEIQTFLGEEAYANLSLLEQQLMELYDLKKALKFPFGDRYGWGYKYNHKTTHLCYAFFEQGQYTVMLQLNDACVDEIEELMPRLSLKLQKLWLNRYPCGEHGGWIHVPVTTSQEVQEILQLLQVKKHRKKK